MINPNYTPRQLKKLVHQLSEIRGRHTELVTVYVPAGYNLNEIRTLVASEAATASNIKSRATRKNVVTALEKVGQRLKSYKQTPPNGLIFFCGNISEREGQPDIQMWEVIPPEPITTRIYRCDQTFILDPLQDMVRERENYGLVTIDTQEAAVAFLHGKSIQVAKKFDSRVPGKQRKGGQSSIRFARIREEILFGFLKEVGEFVNKTYEAEPDLLGIIIGGPGHVKEEFINGAFISEAVKKKILGTKDLGYSGAEGLKELVDRSEDLLKEASVMKEKKLLAKFFEHLKKDTRLVTYGFIEVEHAMNLGAVDTLIVSEGFEFKAYKVKCTSCSFEKEIVVRGGTAAERGNRSSDAGSEGNIPKQCPECGANVNAEEIDVFAKLEEMAKETGANVELVSTETQEGAQFLQLGGIAAILRYVIE